jgi:hypothetical protein
MVNTREEWDELREYIQNHKRIRMEMKINILKAGWNSLKTNEHKDTASEPIHCPACGSDDITYDGRFEEGAIRVICKWNGCDASWLELWQFVAYEMRESKVMGWRKRHSQN